MLRVALADRGASAVLGDALALPLADGCVDAVVLAYVLFHLAHRFGSMRRLLACYVLAAV
jgi:ubiquinone/menaquinone biosynthesis C-methylase UbiE